MNKLQCILWFVGMVMDSLCYSAAKHSGVTDSNRLHAVLKPSYTIPE